MFLQKHGTPTDNKLRIMEKTGRNAPCPCGSGKKYKHCCGLLQDDDSSAGSALSNKLSIQGLLQAGLEHHQSGQLPQAEAIYRQILQVAPNHPDALYLCGLAAHETGRSDAAVELIGRAIRINPSGPFYYSLGNVFYKLDRLDEAAMNFRKALRLIPSMVEAHLGLGNTLKAQNRLDEAIEYFRNAIRLKPDYVDAYNNLGGVLHEQGDLDGAIKNFRKALELKPDMARAYNNLGGAFRSKGKLDEAIDNFGKALELKPDYTEAGCNLGNVFKELHKLDAAIACYREVLKLDPGRVEVLNSLGDALQEQGSQEAAIESFRKALALEPDCIDTHLGLESVYQDTGQFDLAKAHLDHVLSLKPDHPLAWADLPSLRKMTPDDLTWAETALRLLAECRKPQEEMRLCYALGKYHDDMRQYDTAFGYYVRANAMKRKSAGSFNRDEFHDIVDKIIAAHPTDVVRQYYAGCSDSYLPLLIVGMPRSGTSLTEQIIASHQAIFGAGELRFWGKQVQEQGPAMSSGYGDAVWLRDVAVRCEAELRSHSVTALRVVDKMPANFLNLGLIHAAFPQARILHTRRNPADTCLSIYFQNFFSRHTYANDLGDLAFYYREYHRLMAHWRAVLPSEVFLDVPYEALVEDQEGWSRKLIDFIGLEWDERCLNFHETERKVGTASNWQVRQRIYKTSKDRWRNYEKFLGPLFDALGELAPDH